MKKTIGTQVHKSTSTQEHKYICRHELLCACVPVYLCACLVFVLSLSGCTQLKQVQNLDELLVLKDFSDEKDSQQKWVAQEVQRFELLLTAVDDKTIESLTTQDALRERFGDPVIADVIQENNVPVQRWLYRHPIQKLASERVYFFFDTNGHLLRFERLAPPAHEQ